MCCLILVKHFVIILYSDGWGRRGRDRMVVGHLPRQSVPITTKVVSSNPALGEVYSVQYYLIKLSVTSGRFGAFLRVLQFPRPIKLTATI